MECPVYFSRVCSEKKTENIQILPEIYFESLEPLLNTEIQRPRGCSISTVGLSPLQYPKKNSPTSLSSSSAAEPIQHILCNSNPNLVQLSIKIIIDYSSHICLVTGPPKCTELGVETSRERSLEEPGRARSPGEGIIFFLAKGIGKGGWHWDEGGQG